MKRFFSFAVPTFFILISLHSQAIAQAALETAEIESQQTADISTNQLFHDTLADAVRIGEGAVRAYQKGDHTLFVLPPKAFGQLVLWYAEAVSLPPQAESVSGVEIGRLVVSFERHGNRLMVRDHTSGLGKRAGLAPHEPHPSYNMPQQLPIQVSLNHASKGPIVTVFPILAEDDDGNVLIDVTQTFSGDVESLTARYHVQSTGQNAGAVDPARSYISKVKVFESDVDIHSHLTFLTTAPNDTSEMVQPVSIVVGHSFVLLPQTSMSPRAFDDRVGFFNSEYVEYESETGEPMANRSVIHRWRLEKSDPTAAVSTPIKPIVFYIGRDVPDRWKPYVKAGVEQWQPVFEAAGFKHAIIAEDAPSHETNPNWSHQDARHSVIRWLAQSHANAIGPSIYDPRSGEILAAHIQIWPEVLNMFERYYYSVVGTLDPEAATLPMSDSKQGELLQYIVAHEVGHAIGLRHNHLASTAYSVKQLRDPGFANVHGPNSSIMAYGRFNQVAQPGDGVTRFLPILGPYDYFAIKWGYGIHGKNAEEEQHILSELATKSEIDRSLSWAAGEMPLEKEKWINDPRLQQENTGAERVEATRLATINMLRSLEMLPKAVGNNSDLYRKTITEMVSQHITFLQSVAKIVGGTINRASNINEAGYTLIAPEEQYEAVEYLLGDGIQTLEAYKAPKVITKIPPIGGIRTIGQIQGDLLSTIFSGNTLAKLDEQKALYPDAFGPLDLLEAVQKAVWHDLSAAPRWRRALQIRFLDICKNILKTQTHSAYHEAVAVALMHQGHSRSYASLAAASGARTDFPGWARETLPKLQIRLEKASQTVSNQSDQYHFQTMAWHIKQILL